MKATMITALTTMAHGFGAFQEDAPVSDSYVPTPSANPRGLALPGGLSPMMIAGIVALLCVVVAAAMFMMDDQPAAGPIRTPIGNRNNQSSVDNELASIEKENDNLIAAHNKKQREIQRLGQQREKLAHGQKNLIDGVKDKVAVMNHLAIEEKRQIQEQQKELGNVMQVMNNGQKVNQQRVANPAMRPVQHIPAPQPQHAAKRAY